MSSLPADRPVEYGKASQRLSSLADIVSKAGEGYYNKLDIRFDGSELYVHASIVDQGKAKRMMDALSALIPLLPDDG